MTYYQVPMLSNSFLGELDRMENDKYRPSDEILEKAFKVGNQVDYSLFEQQNLDLNDPEIENIYKMRDAVKKHPLFEKYYNHPKAKHQHEIYRLVRGIPIKGKTDSLIKGMLGMEFKTTAHTNELAFFRAAFGEQLNYDRQIPLYMNLAQVDKFILVAVSKKNHKVFVHIIQRGDKIYQQGMEKLNKTFAIYQEYQALLNFNYPNFGKC